MTSLSIKVIIYITSKDYPTFLPKLSEAIIAVIKNSNLLNLDPTTKQKVALYAHVILDEHTFGLTNATMVSGDIPHLTYLNKGLSDLGDYLSKVRETEFSLHKYFHDSLQHLTKKSNTNSTMVNFTEILSSVTNEMELIYSKSKVSVMLIEPVKIFKDTTLASEVLNSKHHKILFVNTTELAIQELLSKKKTLDNKIPKSSKKNSIKNPLISGNVSTGPSLSEKERSTSTKFDKFIP